MKRAQWIIRSHVISVLHSLFSLASAKFIVSFGDFFFFLFSILHHLKLIVLFFFLFLSLFSSFILLFDSKNLIWISVGIYYTYWFTIESIFFPIFFQCFRGVKVNKLFEIFFFLSRKLLLNYCPKLTNLLWGFCFGCTVVTVTKYNVQ